MKAVLHVLTGLLLLAISGSAQNVFNPNDTVYTYNSSSAVGSPTNPNTPAAGVIAKWVRTSRMSWNTVNFKCYYFDGMAFRIRFPNNYNPANAAKYPIVIFYHGGGEIGAVTDNEDQLYWGAQLYEQRINAGEWNGFLLFPQETSIGWDDSYFSRVNNVLDTLQLYNNLDPDKTIAMGLSSGGYGAIAYAQLYPQRVASVVAASPEAASSLVQNPANFVHIPMWLANGGIDTGPNPYEVNSYVTNFRGAGGNCYQTYLADEGHITWSLQWALTNPNGTDILSGWWNGAHKAQPLVFYANDKFCTGTVNARLGITPGYAAYEWQYDNGTGFTDIAGTNEYQATQPGKYRVRFQRSASSGWSAWTPNPVNLTEKTCTTDTLFAERFENPNTYFYADQSYKPGTFGCQNGIFTSSTYNITQDATGRTGGEFLLNNTASGSSCTYTGNDQVWHALNTVTVTPNTTYEFCFYLANRSTSSNAKIVPTINGGPITTGYVQSAGSGNSSWTKFRFLWNSGNASSADLALYNQQSATSGNDFAIDEISFGTPPPNQPPVAKAGADVTLTLPNNSTTLNGSASYDPDGGIASYAWTKISGPSQGAITNPAAATTQITGLAAGVYTFRLLVTDSGGATGSDTVSVTVNPAPPCGALPSGTATTDIGGGGLLGLGGIATGSACFEAPNTYDIKGAGDLATLSDKFRFVYKSFTGDGSLIVKVTTQDAVNASNKAGIMFRESLSGGASYALLALTSGNGALLQSQTLLGLSVSSTSTGAGVIKAPYYLRLVRSGSTFTGAVSADSITWTTIGSKSVSMTASTIYVGMAVCSHTSNTLSEAVFSNWTILNSNGQQVNATNNSGTLTTNESAALRAVLNNGLKVYPNPTNAGFVVDFSIEKKQTVWVAITSGADGRLCYAETLSNFSGNYHKDLGLLHLAKGTYAIILRTETGIKTIILVKQ